MANKPKDTKPEVSKEVVMSAHMEGDIIITDPCYIRGIITPTHVRSTIHGDWGCHVWEYNSAKESEPAQGTKAFGRFCADGGEVCVTVIPKGKMAAIKRHFQKCPWCATIIPKFKGTVRYIIMIRRFMKHGEWKTTQSLRVQGDGTRKGDPFAFMSAQTSL